MWMMLRSFSTKTPLYFDAAGEVDLFRTRSSQSEFKPEKLKRLNICWPKCCLHHFTILVFNPWQVEGEQC